MCQISLYGQANWSYTTAVRALFAGGSRHKRQSSGGDSEYTLQEMQERISATTSITTTIRTRPPFQGLYYEGVDKP